MPSTGCCFQSWPGLDRAQPLSSCARGLIWPKDPVQLQSSGIRGRAEGLAQTRPTSPLRSEYACGCPGVGATGGRLPAAHQLSGCLAVDKGA